MERAAADKREPVGPTIESRGLIFVFRLEMLSRSMSRVDRKEEKEEKKRKLSFSNSPYFYGMKIRRRFFEVEGAEEEISRSIDITDSGYISAIRLKGIEMNIGSHDESSSLN